MNLEKIMPYDVSKMNDIVPLGDFLLSLVLTAALCYAMSVIYIRYAGALTNRKRLAKTFVLLGLTTALVITTVKSSLALSLGLVGALSIVRFRAAIKDPEELVYLFFCIAVGLGFGAGQFQITLIGFAVAVLVIYLQRRKQAAEDPETYILGVSGINQGDIDIDKITDTFNRLSIQANLRRIDESAAGAEAIFTVRLPSIKELVACRKELHQLSPDLRVTFFDSRADL